MEYYDTDSIYCDFEQFKLHDTLKVVRPTAKERLAMKLYLNSVYGKMLSSMKWTDGKENNGMRIKDFIVLHADGQPVMIKKEAITVVSKMSDGTTRVEIDNQIWITDDKYEDVIKRMFDV